MLSVAFAFYHFHVECHNAEYHDAECHNGECRYAERLYAECLYAECRYAECRGVTRSKVFSFSKTIFLLKICWKFNQANVK